MESKYYRDNLASILEFTNGRHVLTTHEVGTYTGFRDNRTVKRRYPIVDGYISAETLARELCRGVK